MAATKNLRLAALALSFAVAGPAALVAACSSSSSNGNPTPVTYDANVTTDSTTPTGDDASGGSGDDVSAVVTEDGATSDVREEPVVLEDAQACTVSRAPAQGAQADAGCWSCAPQSTPEFLNQCATTGVTCVSFDNARVPGWDGGAPPSLN